MNKKYTSGFTLLELVIAMTIFSLLAAITIPAYNNNVTKTRRTDGQVALMDIMSKQERYYTENNTYTTDLTALAGGTSNSSSHEGYYTLSATACGSGISSCVQLKATAGAAQSSDGDLTLDSRGAKTGNW